MHSDRAAEGGRAEGWGGGGGGDKQGWCSQHFSAVPVCSEKMECHTAQKEARHTASMP